MSKFLFPREKLKNKLHQSVSNEKTNSKFIDFDTILNGITNKQESSQSDMSKRKDECNLFSQFASPQTEIIAVRNDFPPLKEFTKDKNFNYNSPESVVLNKEYAEVFKKFEGNPKIFTFEQIDRRFSKDELIILLYFNGESFQNRGTRKILLVEALKRIIDSPKGIALPATVFENKVKGNQLLSCNNLPHISIVSSPENKWMKSLLDLEKSKININDKNEAKNLSQNIVSDSFIKNNDEYFNKKGSSPNFFATKKESSLLSEFSPSGMNKTKIDNSNSSQNNFSYNNNNNITSDKKNDNISVLSYLTPLSSKLISSNSDSLTEEMGISSLQDSKLSVNSLQMNEENTLSVLNADNSQSFVGSLSEENINLMDVENSSSNNSFRDTSSFSKSSNYSKKLSSSISSLHSSCSCAGIAESAKVSTVPSPDLFNCNEDFIRIQKAQNNVSSQKDEKLFSSNTISDSNNNFEIPHLTAPEVDLSEGMKTSSLNEENKSIEDYSYSSPSILHPLSDESNQPYSSSSFLTDNSISYESTKHITNSSPESSYNSNLQRMNNVLIDGSLPRLIFSVEEDEDGEKAINIDFSSLNFEKLLNKKKDTNLSDNKDFFKEKGTITLQDIKESNNPLQSKDIIISSNVQNSVKFKNSNSSSDSNTVEEDLILDDFDLFSEDDLNKEKGNELNENVEYRKKELSLSLHPNELASSIPENDSINKDYKNVNSSSSSIADNTSNDTLQIERLHASSSIFSNCNVSSPSNDISSSFTSVLSSSSVAISHSPIIPSSCFSVSHNSNNTPSIKSYAENLSSLSDGIELSEERCSFIEEKEKDVVKDADNSLTIIHSPSFSLDNSISSEKCLNENVCSVSYKEKDELEEKEKHKIGEELSECPFHSLYIGRENDEKEINLDKNEVFHLPELPISFFSLNYNSNGWKPPRYLYKEEKEKGNVDRDNDFDSMDLAKNFKEEEDFLLTKKNTNDSKSLSYIENNDNEDSSILNSAEPSYPLLIHRNNLHNINSFSSKRRIFQVSDSSYGDNNLSSSLSSVSELSQEIINTDNFSMYTSNSTFSSPLSTKSSSLLPSNISISAREDGDKVIANLLGLSQSSNINQGKEVSTNSLLSPNLCTCNKNISIEYKNIELSKVFVLNVPLFISFFKENVASIYSEYYQSGESSRLLTPKYLIVDAGEELFIPFIITENEESEDIVEKKERENNMNGRYNDNEVCCFDSFCKIKFMNIQFPKCVLLPFRTKSDFDSSELFSVPFLSSSEYVSSSPFISFYHFAKVFRLPLENVHFIVKYDPSTISSASHKNSYHFIDYTFSSFNCLFFSSIKYEPPSVGCLVAVPFLKKQTRKIIPLSSLSSSQTENSLSEESVSSDEEKEKGNFGNNKRIDGIELKFNKEKVFLPLRNEKKNEKEGNNSSEEEDEDTESDNIEDDSSDSLSLDVYQSLTKFKKKRILLKEKGKKKIEFHKSCYNSQKDLNRVNYLLKKSKYIEESSQSKDSSFNSLPSPSFPSSSSSLLSSYNSNYLKNNDVEYRVGIVASFHPLCKQKNKFSDLNKEFTFDYISSSVESFSKSPSLMFVIWLQSPNVSSKDNDSYKNISDAGEIKVNPMSSFHSLCISQRQADNIVPVWATSVLDGPSFEEWFKNGEIKKRESFFHEFSSLSFQPPTFISSPLYSSQSYIERPNISYFCDILEDNLKNYTSFPLENKKEEIFGIFNLENIMENVRKEKETDAIIQRNERVLKDSSKKQIIQTLFEVIMKHPASLFIESFTNLKAVCFLFFFVYLV